MVFPPQEDFSRIVIRTKSHKCLEAETEEGQCQRGNYDKGAGAVGKVVEVYWEGEGEWFRGRLTRYRDADQKHRCDYEDGESEWLTLSENSVRFPDGDVVLSPQQQTRKVCEPINGFSCQKLGVLVWAKTGKYPWWPAETCLLAVDELTKHFPPNPLRAATRRREGNDDGPLLWRRADGCGGCGPCRAVLH